MIKDKEGEIIPIGEFVEKLEKELRNCVKYTRKLSKGIVNLSLDTKSSENQSAMTSEQTKELRRNTDKLLDVSRTTLKVAKELVSENEKIEKRCIEQGRQQHRLQEQIKLLQDEARDKEMDSKWQKRALNDCERTIEQLQQTLEQKEELIGRLEKSSDPSQTQAQIQYSKKKLLEVDSENAQLR